MAEVAGIEPACPGLEVPCLNPLGHTPTLSGAFCMAGFGSVFALQLLHTSSPVFARTHLVPRAGIEPAWSPLKRRVHETALPPRQIWCRMQDSNLRSLD